MGGRGRGRGGALLGEVEEDGARLEDGEGRVHRAVDERGRAPIGVDGEVLGIPLLVRRNIHEAHIVLQLNGHRGWEGVCACSHIRQIPVVTCSSSRSAATFHVLGVSAAKSLNNATVSSSPPSGTSVAYALMRRVHVGGAFTESGMPTKITELDTPM